jgi:Flp pilus assembly protein TadG
MKVISVFLKLPKHRIRDRERSTIERRRSGVVRKRTGAAALEAAISVPLIVTIVFGAIEISNAIYLRQSLNMAAYEAAKVVTKPGTNETLARTRCAEILNIRSVSSYTLTFTPTITTATPRGTPVTVTITGNASNLSYGPVRFMAGRNVTARVVMVRL